MGNFEGGPRTCLKVGILKASRQGQRRYNSDADLGILDGVHIGASWRIRLNRPCEITSTTCYAVRNLREFVDV